MRIARLLPVMAVALGLLAVPALAGATITIGSNLQRVANASTSCFPNCTAVLGSLDLDLQASGGLASPVDGTVTMWRIRAGIGSGSVAFRLVRPLAGGTYTGDGTSAAVTPPTDAIGASPVQLPIRRGDLIGIDCCAGPSGNAFFTGFGTGGRIFFEPGFLADGGPGASPSGTDTFEILLNADIEPTSAFTVGKAKRKKGGAITMIAQLPNPGALTAAGKGKPRLVKPSVLKAGPGAASVALAMTKRARALLADREHLKLHVKLTFTPDGGSAATRKVSVTLHDVESAKKKG